MPQRRAASSSPSAREPCVPPTVKSRPYRAATLRRLRAFGSAVEAEWSPASYALVSAVLSFLEPDPAASWNEERIAASFRRVDELEREIMGTAT